MNRPTAEEVSRLKATYGSVPPPWIVAPAEHPYSLYWRMGTGEWHVMVWTAWWKQQEHTKAQAISYFRRWPPPPVWLPWMIDVLWQPEDWNPDEDTGDTKALFAHTEALGFGSRDDYRRDSEDPNWLPEGAG